MGNQQERPFNYLEKMKDEITRLYLNEHKSLRAIAKITDSSMSGIKRILHKYDIPRRNKCDSLNLCPNSFTEEEYQIVLGSSLGDGHITKPKQNGESQLYIGHSPKQKEYLEWKHEKFKRFIGCKIYPLEHSLKYKGEIRKYTTWNFLTRKSKLFTEFRNMFYSKMHQKHMKILPIKLLQEKLQLLGLAIWYMDDGCGSGSGFNLYTQSFTYDDNIKLLRLLKEKFDFDGKIREAKNKKYFLVFGCQDKSKLCQKISQYIVPCLRYKIERNPQRLYVKCVLET